MADFSNALKLLGTQQLDYIKCLNYYKLSESVIGFTSRNVDELIDLYSENANLIREYPHYHDSTQCMHEVQLIVKSSNMARVMSQYGFASILKNVVDIKIAGEINKYVSDVTAVRNYSDDNKEFVKYAKILFIVKKEDAYNLNKTIKLIKKYIIPNTKLIRLLGGNGVDSVCHFTTNRNSAYLYKYRIFGLRPNFHSCSIKSIESLQQLAIWFTINFKQLIPLQWEFYVTYDALNLRFKPNSFELSSNTRIENLSELQRVFVPENLTINGLPCGLDIRITRLGTAKRVTNNSLLIENEAQKSEFQQKMDGLCTHQPIIDNIHKQALQFNKFEIAVPLLIQAMSRIYNYKDKNGNITPQDTISYAIDHKLWTLTDNGVKFEHCINERSKQFDENDADMAEMQNDFGGPHNDNVSHRDL